MNDTIRIRQGEIKPVLFQLMNWDFYIGNMVEFDLTNYIVYFSMYLDGSAVPTIDMASCDIDTAAEGKGHYDIDTTGMLKGMYTAYYVADNGTELYEFPEYTTQWIFIN